MAAAYSKRCPISHRPPFRSGEPVFYLCPSCGELIVRNKRPDTEDADAGIRCCGKDLFPLPVKEGEDIPPEHGITFTVFGGFEENAVRVLVEDGTHPMTDEHCIEWVYYRSFQGGQLKYLPKRGRAIATFSFADEDAYVYCDRDICRMGKEHCQFCCKRGNVIYVYCNVHGLMKLSMDGF